jgi:hypothetical protein
MPPQSIFDVLGIMPELFIADKYAVNKLERPGSDRLHKKVTRSPDLVWYAPLRGGGEE